MATKKKLLQAAAGQAGGAALNVEDVFSTYLFTPNTSGNFSVTNNIDLDGEGGLVWLKQRDVSANHLLYDTNRGASAGRLASNLTNSEALAGVYFDAFNSDGFTVKDMNNDEMASWTFRKAPKFFDVVTYTGTNATRTLNHNLGSVPGCIMFKNISEAGNWEVVFPNQGSNDFLYGYLNLTGALSDMSYAVAVQNNVVLASAPTSTSIELTPDDYTGFNKLGSEYVAYLFAHNDGDGEFGPDGDQDIIKCGSYTGNGSTDGPEIDLGFEPQWLLWKNADGTDNWEVADVMRGMPADGTTGRMRILRPNTSGSEFSDNETEPKPTGFKITNPGGNNNDNGSTYIYMAIRRGPLAQPESGTEVFDVSTRNASEPAYTSGFPVDFALARAKNIANNWDTGSRLQQGNRMFTNLTNAEASNSNMMFDYQDGWSAGTGASTEYLSWMWKRAPKFFDVVAYTGDGVAGRTVSHNLGVAPEMIWVKKRNAAEGWQVYHSALTATDFMELNQTFSASSSTGRWNNTEPTATDFTLGSITHTNASGDNYIAYLFASLPNVSKCGSYTGNGTSQNIDCGFTSGARFVLIKVTSTADNWFMWDTLRGISVGPDSYLRLDITNAETDGNDRLDPYSGGFAVRTNDTSVNKSGESYIFYAIA